MQPQGKKTGLLFKACVLHTELPCKMLPCVAHGTRKALSWDPAWPPSSLKTGGEMVGCRSSEKKDFPSERGDNLAGALCSGKLMSVMPTLLLLSHIVDCRNDH